MYILLQKILKYTDIIKWLKKPCNKFLFSFPSLSNQNPIPSQSFPISLPIKKPTKHIPSQTRLLHKLHSRPHTIAQRLPPAHRSVCRLQTGVSAAFCTLVLPLRCSVEPFSHNSNNPRQVVFFCLFFLWISCSYFLLIPSIYGLFFEFPGLCCNYQINVCVFHQFLDFVYRFCLSD